MAKIDWTKTGWITLDPARAQRLDIAPSTQTWQPTTEQDVRRSEHQQRPTSDKPPEPSTPHSQLPEVVARRQARKALVRRGRQARRGD